MGDIDIHKKLGNFTLFLDDNKTHENRGQDTISQCGVYRYFSETREFHPVSGGW